MPGLRQDQCEGPSPVGLLRGVLIGLGAATPVILVAVILIIVGPSSLRGDLDESRFHLPTILTFAEELPSPGLRDYQSATTPGYHLILASVARLVSPDVHVLRVAGLGFTLGLAGAVGVLVSGRGVSGWLVVIVLPVFCSMYVVSSAARLLPDNAGWCGVAMLMALAMRWPAGWRGALLAAVALVFAVSMRQIHVWAIAPVWTAAWLGARPLGGEEDRGLLADIPLLFEGCGARARAVVPVLLAGLPAVALLGWFAWLWGGLTPPSFQGQHNTGLALVGPAFLLAQFGVFGLFFSAWLFASALRLLRERRATLVLAAGVGLAFALAPPSVFDASSGRMSGLWNILRHTPSVADRSPVLAVMAAWGAVAVAAWLEAMPRRERWICLAAIVAFAAAHVANPQVWQRYYEPFALLMSATMTALGSATPGEQVRKGGRLWWAYFAPLALAALLCVLNVAKATESGPDGRGAQTPAVGRAQPSN